MTELLDRSLNTLKLGLCPNNTHYEVKVCPSYSTLIKRQQKDCSRLLIISSTPCHLFQQQNFHFLCDLRTTAHLSDNTATQQASWRQCCCGLPQYFTHMSKRQCSDSRSVVMQMSLDPQPHTHHPGPSHCLSDQLSCNIHEGVYTMYGVYILDNFSLLIQVNSSRRFWIGEFRTSTI